MRDYLLDEGVTLAKVLLLCERERGSEEERYAFVIWEVMASISRSSCERSEKPGRTCFAWSLSRAWTSGDERRRGAERERPDSALGCQLRFPLLGPKCRP